MEVFECGPGSSDEVRIDFGRFIRAVELNCERTLLNRKNQVLLRQRLKQEWLCRSKIIPPSLPPHTATPVSPTISLLPTAFLTSSDSTSDLPRATAKTLHRNLRNVASCERVRSNWKLEFRKDELNVLRYARREGRDDGEGEERAFKVRRVNRKFEELRAEAHSLYRTNLAPQDEQHSRERLKTTQNPSLSRQRGQA